MRELRRSGDPHQMHFMDGQLSAGKKQMIDAIKEAKGVGQRFAL